MAAPGRPGTAHDFSFEAGVVFLLFFSPLAFGSVRPWAYNIMEFVVFSLLSLWLAGSVKDGCLKYAETPLLFFIPLSILFFAVQLIPLPRALLTLVSPGNGLMMDAAGRPASGGTVALYPWAAREQAAFLLAVEGCFFLVINHVKNERQVRRVIIALLASGVVLSVLALAQKAALDGTSFLPFVNKNHFAGYMEALLSVAAAFIFPWAGRQPGETGMKGLCSALSGPWALTASLALASSLLFVCAIILTGSRGGALGVVALFAFLAFLTGRDLKRKALVLAVAAFLLTGGFVLSSNGYVKARMGAVKAILEDPAAKWRLRIWNDTVPIIADFPLAGAGLGNFGNVFPAYKTIDDERNVFQPENDYIYLLAEGGALGFVLAAAFSALFIKRVHSNFQRRKNPLSLSMAAGCMTALAALGVHGLVDTNLHIPATLFLVSVVMALGYACSGFRFMSNDRENALLRDKTVSLRPKAARAAAALCAAVFAVLALRSAAAASADLFYISALRDKSLAVRAGFRPEAYMEALEKLEISSRLAPGRSESLFEQGRTYYALSEYYAHRKDADQRLALEYRRKALARLEEALEANPYSSFAHLLKGMVMRGSSGAEKEFEAALRLNPKNGFIRRCSEYKRGNKD